MIRIIVTLCLIYSSSSYAEAVIQAELEACAALRDPLDSLSCFERLTDRGRLKVPERPVVATPATVEAPTAKATTPVKTPEVAQTEPVSGARESRRAPVQESVGKVISIDDSVGEEHLDKPKQDQGPTKFSATIVKVEKKGRNILVFHMDNGQVWRQLESRFFAYPKNRAFEVEINQGVLGDYRMRVEGKGRHTRIRRMK